MLLLSAALLPKALSEVEGAGLRRKRVRRVRRVIRVTEHGDDIKNLEEWIQ